jgi:hypothetical protein
MNKPKVLKWFPSDIRQFEGGTGLWFYLPEWIVRAYKLKTMNISGQVMITIVDKKRSISKWKKDETNSMPYWKENWKAKLHREQHNLNKTMQVKE